MLRVLSANVNGVRAAARRGGLDWIAAQQPDVVCLQEVRAGEALLHEALTGSAFADWQVAHDESTRPGHAGVAVLTREPALAVRYGVGRREFVGTGRWVEVDLATAAGPLTVASTYVHTGHAGTERQATKERFLAAVGRRMSALRRTGSHVVVTGDLNVAHTDADLKNWKGNRGKAGCLPSERAQLDRWTSSRGGYVDVHRALAGEGPGPYTWWSWRGQAFDNDAGWRIDYQLATTELASRAVKAEAGRAATYAERWSDHAAVVVDYDVP
ncbi:exodeoxyribonuclease III [Angustibacter sp. McL0619]|uniref:exodeoxyribonuclease III n=1 Tax=Angustibacter sp. McL0619 TaxID=3415676 RepID=UPI003CEC9CA3